MTTPNMDKRVATSRDDEIYEAARNVATKPRALPSRRASWLRAAEGALLGIAFSVIALTLGIPWVFHIGGLDALLPSAVVGAVLGMTRWRAVPWAIVAVLSIVLLVVAFTPVIRGPLKALVRNDPFPQSADAIMVLSAGINDDGRVSQQAMDRLVKGLELLNRGIAPLLVVSREAYIINGRRVTSREDQERVLSLSPGALTKVIVAGITHSTHDEAIRAARLMHDRGWKRLIVVTSPAHTRRACAVFERAGIVVSCVSSEFREAALESMSSPDDRLKAFQLWLYETAGSIRYRQLGWL